MNQALHPLLDRASRLLRDPAEVDDDDARTCSTLSGDVAGALLEFLGHARAGALNVAPAKNEARAWIELGVGRWPFASVVARELLVALTGIVALPEPCVEEADEPAPATALERALAAAIDDPTTRPTLWRALWKESVVLPVAGVDFDSDPRGAVFRFVTTTVGGEPMIFAFTTPARLDALAGPGHGALSQVTVRGYELARFWPQGHWLVINPGARLTTVLGPDEVRGLPHGSTTA